MLEFVTTLIDVIGGTLLSYQNLFRKLSIPADKIILFSFVKLIESLHLYGHRHFNSVQFLISSLIIHGQPCLSFISCGQLPVICHVTGACERSPCVVASWLDFILFGATGAN